MKKTAIISLLLASLSAAMLGGCAAASPYTVQVLLTEGEGYTVLSDNPMTVRAGEDAVFSVALDEGWHCADADGGTYADGTFTVEDVYFPATVSMTASDAEKPVRFFVERGGDGAGRAQSDETEYTLYPGTVIEAWAEPSDGSYFAGWSIDREMAAGGKLYSTDTRIEYTVPGSSRNFLYANFFKLEVEEAPDINSSNLDGPTKKAGKYGIQGNESIHRIVYNANGGRVVGYDSDTFYDKVSTAVFVCPNTLPEMGYFTRDGYLLLEYNTKPDGSGEAIPCGGKFLPEGDETTLYCIWAKCTDEKLFKTENHGKGVAITGYTGSEKTLVIPETIGGKPVLRIKKGAVTSGDYTTLILPKTLETVDSGAFTNSAKMQTMYFYDTIKTIKDAGFSDLSGWKNLRIIAAQLPRYSKTADATFCRKWERLQTLAKTDAKLLVVCSGSSSYYAMRSPLLEEELDGEYSVVNYGHLARTQVTFYMDAIADFLDENDIIVHAPETSYDGVMGANVFHWTNFQVIEHSYDLLYHIDDIGFYKKLLDAFTEFNGYRAKMSPQDYDIFSTDMDEYGDRILPMPNNGDPNKFFGKDIDLTTIDPDQTKNLNTMYGRVMEQTGCRILMSFAPFNYNALTQPSRTESARETFMERIRETVDIPVISHIWDYMMPGEMMYNSDYHPGDEGRVIRTKLLARDLTAYFAKEGEQ